MQIDNYKNWYKTHKEKTLFHRYIFSKNIVDLLDNLPSVFNVETLGKSVLNEDIFSVTFGNGSKKILMWSQMHGNESTTTKAIFDVFNTFSVSKTNLKSILEACTIKIIPILNVDGAKLYTRLNANTIDLNRDAQNLSQPESRVLRQVFDDFKPDFCFNLHGQRTIFGVGNSGKPATVSFLAPSQDENTSVTTTRKIAMSIIVKLNTMLQSQIPNQVGIYDDAFNINCVGDTFQSLNVPSVLFEAGHFTNDYEREQTRFYIYQSLLTALFCIADDSFNDVDYKHYFNIPENKKNFYDIIIRNANVLKNGVEAVLDIAIQYQEKLIDNRVHFVPKVEKISDLSLYFGHKEIDADKKPVLSNSNKSIYEGYENDFVIIGNERFSLIL